VQPIHRIGWWWEIAGCLKGCGLKLRKTGVLSENTLRILSMAHYVLDMGCAVIGAFGTSLVIGSIVP
jgi:hypothetical protein